MVKIETLFNAYELQTSSILNVNEIFSASGMKNRFNELEKGFFPLGSGILTDQCKSEDAEIEENGAMILGHDFGTISYVDSKCDSKRENNSKTIDNLIKLGLTLDKTFFTNFYLGLRDDDKHPKMKMTELVVNRKKEYKEFCLAFFLTQLKTINPSIVICLGKEIRSVLYEYFPDHFPNLKKKSLTYYKLFENGKEKKYAVQTDDSILGKRKFVFIPHPSYAHINWSSEIRIKIQDEII